MDCPISTKCAWLRRLVFFTVLMVTASSTTSYALADLVQDQADIVVGYGATEASRFGSASALQAAVYAQYGTANSVAANSGTPLRQHIVGFIQSATDCDNLTTTGGMVGWLGNNDGHVSDVVAYANAMGADLLTYIAAFSDSGIAGVANQPGRYSAYNNQVYWTYFAHESGGHNFGGNHGDGVPNPVTVMIGNYCNGGAQPFYTNPNIWYNGVKLLGTGNCQGSPIYGGDFAYMSSNGAQGVFDRYDRVVYGSLRYPITYRWQFNKTAGAAPASTVVSDEVSNAPATVRGQGATFTGKALRLPGGTTGNVAANSIAAYLDLPNGMFSGMTNWTVEIWAAPQSVQNWERIIDIGNTADAGDGLGATGEYTGTPGSPAPSAATNASDDIFLSAAIGTNLAQQRFSAQLAAANSVTSNSTLATNAGDLHYYTLTFTDVAATGGTIKWYRDGVLVSTLAVGFHSASLHDVNNWLGRSMYSGDSQANIDYYDMRVQGVALSDGNVAANYLIGPNDAKSTLYSNDAYNSSGFTNGSWEFGSVPVSTRDYETGTLRLRTPHNANNTTFPGRSLSITGGSLNLDASGAKTTTINNLTINGAEIVSTGDNASTQTLAGNITVPTNANSHMRGASGYGPLVVSATITGGVGGGGILYTENPVTLTGNNTGYLGATIIGDGRFSTLNISSEANLGGNPSFYGGAWLQLNRGILATTQTMSISNANRGILIGPSGGFFNPVAGTTLTIATPVNSPAAGNTVQTSPMSTNPTVGILFVNGQGTVVFTNPNNSHNAEMQILSGELRLSGSGRLNNGTHSWPVTINSLFTDNSTLDQTMNGVIGGSGRVVEGGTATLWLWGANSYTGGTTINSGAVGAGNSTALGTGTITMNGGLLENPPYNPNNLVYTLTNPIAVNGSSSLLGTTGDFVLNGNITGSGTLGLSGTYNGSGLHLGGTNSGYTGIANVSGTNVRLDTGSATSAAAAWNVTGGLQLNAAGATTFNFGSLSGSGNITGHVAQSAGATQTLNVGSLNTGTTFSGTITDNAVDNGTYGNGDGAAKNVLALTKAGTGTLTLSGANTYSGPTNVTSGTLNLTGSLTGAGAVTVSGATLSGAGAVKGSLAFTGTSNHYPGNPTGVQPVGGALAYSASSRVKYTLLTNSNATGVASGVSASGTLTVASGAVIDLGFNGTGSAVNFGDVFWTQARTWPVVASQGMTGSFALGTVSIDSYGHMASSYGTFSLLQGSTGATLQWTPRSLFAFQGGNFGSNLANPAISGYYADPDGDGISNIFEAFYGTNPNVSAANPLQLQKVGGRLGLLFPRDTSITDTVATIQGADAVAGPWTNLAQSVGGANFASLVTGASVSESATGTDRTGTGSIDTVSFTDMYLMSDTAHPHRFLRLSIQPQ